MNPGPATSIELTKLSSFKIFPISRPISFGLFLVIFPNIKAILHVRSPFSGLSGISIWNFEEAIETSSSENRSSIWLRILFFISSAIISSS